MEYNCTFHSGSPCTIGTTIIIPGPSHTPRNKGRYFVSSESAGEVSELLPEDLVSTTSMLQRRPMECNNRDLVGTIKDTY